MGHNDQTVAFTLNDEAVAYILVTLAATSSSRRPTASKQIKKETSNYSNQNIRAFWSDVTAATVREHPDFLSLENSNLQLHKKKCEQSKRHSELGCAANKCVVVRSISSIRSSRSFRCVVVRTISSIRSFRSF